MKPVFLSLFLALALPAPLAAQTFTASNGVAVTPVPSGFSVSDGGGYGARGMWCAAAEYAQRVLGAPVISRIYIVEPRTNVRGPVVFSTSPYVGATQQLLITGLSLRQKGANLSLGHALGFCADARETNR